MEKERGRDTIIDNCIAKLNNPFTELRFKLDLRISKEIINKAKLKMKHI